VADSAAIVAATAAISEVILALLDEIRAFKVVILAVFASTFPSNSVIFALVELIEVVLVVTLESKAAKLFVSVDSAALAVRPSAVIASTFALIPFVLEAIVVCCEVILAVLD